MCENELVSHLRCRRCRPILTEPVIDTVERGSLLKYLCKSCGSRFRFLRAYSHHLSECGSGPHHFLESDRVSVADECTAWQSFATEEPRYSASPCPTVINTSLSDLCLELEGRHRCCKAAIDAVVQSVKRIALEQGISINADCLTSDRNRKLYYHRCGIYVPPKVVTLSSGKKSYFVPLEDLLRNLLKHPEIATHAQATVDMSADGIMYDFKDGAYYSSHPVLSQHRKNVLALNIYCDDLEIANPIGTKRGDKGKLTVFYIAILNLPPHLRSSLNQIFLLAVGYSRYLKSSTEKAELLEDAIEVMQRLATTGIEFATPNGNALFHGFVACFTGDALAANNITGFKESFGPNVLRCCRTCSVITKKISQYSYHSQCPLRNDHEINMQWERIKTAAGPEEKKTLSREFGINGDSVLKQFPHFRLTKAVLYDPMHILLEGLVPKEITQFLNVAVKKKKWFSRKQLNNALKNFHFHSSVSRSNYPRPFETDLQVIASASTALILILHFPLIVHPLLPAEAAMFVKCLIHLAQITQISLSPVVRADTACDLEELIAEHHRMYCMCYGSDALTAKHHMLIHIPDQIRNFGPGRHHWTMRMESKNSIPKGKKYFNFKNIPYSVACYYQINQSFALWHGSGKAKTLCSHETLSSKAKGQFVLDKRFLAVGIRDYVGKTGLSVDVVHVNKVKIQPMDILLAASSSGGELFAKVNEIVVYEDIAFFVCMLMSAVHHDSARNVFALKETGLTKVVRSSQFLHPWPIYTYPEADCVLAIPPSIHFSSHLSLA